MLRVQGGSDEHDIFKKRCALAASGSLAPAELSELRAHLERCEECREILLQYRILTTQGMGSLADAYGDRFEEAAWDGANVRERLLARVSNDQQMLLHRKSPASVPVPFNFLQRIATNHFAKIALAATLILAITSGAYRLGLRKQIPADAKITPDLAEGQLQKLVQEKNAAGELSTAQTKKLAELQSESSAKQREIDKLQSALRAVEVRSSELAAANSQSGAQLQSLLQQRTELSASFSREASLRKRQKRTREPSLRTRQDSATNLGTRIEDCRSLRDQSRSRAPPEGRRAIPDIRSRYPRTDGRQKALRRGDVLTLTAAAAPKSLLVEFFTRKGSPLFFTPLILIASRAL